MSRTHLTLNGKRYAFQQDYATGKRAFSVTPRTSQPGDPGGMDYREWTPWGPDLNSRRTQQGYLGREYGDGTDGRWENVDTLGPEMGTLDLTTYDAGLAHDAALLDISFVLDGAPTGGTSGFMDGAVSVSAADAQEVIKSTLGVTYAYVMRGQIPAKVRLSNLTLINHGKSFIAPATAHIVTRSPQASTLSELSVGMGSASPYEVLKQADISATVDAWAANASSITADAFGQAPDRVLALDGRTVRGNMLTGSVTMVAPSYSTVATITNLDAFTFTGYALDGNVSLLGTTRGPLVLNVNTAEFRPLVPEIDPNAENCRGMSRWYPIGVMMPLRDGRRSSDGLQGESIGIERFLGNASLVRGYPTGGDGSSRWWVDAIYDELTGDSWIVASRPRQAGDPHPHPLSFYVLGHLTAQQARYVDYVGYANGERTMPLWCFGRGTSMGYFLDGRTTRFIDDTSYRYAAAGTTYGAEEYLDGVVADIEAVELMTDNCTANRTVIPKISIDGGTSYVSLATQTSNGFHRVLAVSAGVPLATLQGANRIKYAETFASNSATSAPRVISKVRVYFRWRPLEVRDFTYPLELVDQEEGETAVAQKTALEALPTSVPVLVASDQDDASYYVRVNKVETQETTLESGDELTGTAGRRFTATINATEWKVA